MTEVSIIMGARGRAKSTQRTLQSYTKLSYKDYELLFVEIKHDGDNLEPIYNVFKDQLPIRYFSLEENLKSYIPGVTSWTPATTWNFGMTQAIGKFIIICGADILLSYPDMIEKFLDQYKDNRVGVLTYYLSPLITDLLGTGNVDWMNDPLAISNLPGFWDVPVTGDINRNRTSAGLTTFLTGQPREAWDYMGGFRTELSHLVNDQDLYLREVALGKRCETMKDYFAYHQAHPFQKATTPICSPGWHYANEKQARLQEPAERDAT